MQNLQAMKNLLNAATFMFVVLSIQSCNLLSAAGISSQGQPTKKVETNLTSTTANSAINIDHSQWDKLLKKHVNNEGLVDYKSFQKDRSQLNSYLKMLSEKDPSKDWSVQELLAYYINLYNASTVELILNNYPTKSIQDIKANFTKGFIKIGSRELSLGGLENGVIREMNEPRIHFAVNCASISCPKLINEAYTAAKINEQLDRATKEFINSAENDISASNPKLSSIFDWYQKDFQVNGKTDVIAFINQYSKTKINTEATITYKDYNWNLNEAE